MKQIIPVLSIPVVLIIILILSGCPTEKTATLKREKLFELQIGRMEDQLDMLYVPGQTVRRKTRILMRNGLFYISNGNASKLMEFTSYGDILSLFYNPEVNPEPILLRESDENTGENTVSNRRAFRYPFREVGELGITGDKTLLVEDRVSEIQQEYDRDIEAMLNRVVLRFDAEGNYMDYLGQEGVGGTPFSYIESIQVTDSDEIVVIARSVQYWLVFWFSREGSLLYRATISRTNLPILEDSKLLPSLGSIFADTDEHLLYLKIDYYGTNREDEEQGMKNIYFQISRIWWYDLEKESFGGSVDIPVRVEDFRISEYDKGKKIRNLYTMLGIAGSNVFFLMAHHRDDLFELTLLKRDGSVITRNFIEIPEKSVVYRDFHLSESGVLSALLVKEYTADVVWWRTDRFLEDGDETGVIAGNGGD